MKELSAKSAAILRAAQRHEAPAADVRARVWEQTRLRAAAGDLGPALPETAVSTSVATSKLLAWVAAAAVGGGAVVGGVLLAREPAPATGPAPGEVEEVVREVDEPIEPAPVPIEPAPVLVVEPLEEPAEATVTEVTVPRRRAPAKAATKQTKDAEKESGSAFGEEVELLARARAAIGRGEASKALSLLEQHAKQFPRGALGPERDVSRIMALCALGRVEQAREHATAFLRRHPRSALAERVRRTCAGDP